VKILHLIDSGGLYGAESVILNLSREMQFDEKYTPFVGCIVSHPDEPCDLYNKALGLGLLTEKLVIRNSLLIVDIPRVARLLKKKDVSLIHSHGYKPSVFGFFIRFISGIPVMATCHLWFLEKKIPMKMRAMIWLELLLYRYFPIIVSVSEAIKNTLVQHGIAEDKLRTIKNGIVLADYVSLSQEKIKEKIEELELKEKELCFLNVARLTHQKAQWHIVTVARKLKDAGEKVKFFIVGEGPLRDILQKQIKESGVEDYVYLLGFRPDVVGLLQVADVFLLPSLDEGMPMALLEAVASKTPVIATPVGDITNLLRDGHSGVIVNVDDVESLFIGVRRMLDSVELRQNCAVAAYDALYKDYSSLAMYRSYAQLYSRFL